jgi:hypothetical protein
MADVTYYVALPFLQDDSGAPRRARRKNARAHQARSAAPVLSKVPGNVGAVAFSPAAIR